MVRQKAAWRTYQWQFQLILLYKIPYDNHPNPRQPEFLLRIGHETKRMLSAYASSNAQLSLRIRAVWTEPLMFAHALHELLWIYMINYICNFTIQIRRLVWVLALLRDAMLLFCDVTHLLVVQLIIFNFTFDLMATSNCWEFYEYKLESSYFI